MPDDVGFFSRAEWTRFQDVVETDFRRRGLIVEIETTAVTRPGSDWSASLVHVAQSCYHERDSRWPGIVVSHFDSLLESAPEADPVSQDTVVADIPTSTEELGPVAARAALRVRLYPPSFAGEGRVSWPITGGIVVGLAVDLPDRVESISPEQLHAWGITTDEAFDIGRSNVRASGGLSIGGTHPAGEPGLIWLTGNDLTTTAHALWLDEVLDNVPEAGALLAVPHRHAVIVHLLIDRDLAIAAVNLMLHIADDAYREGPGSLSPSLYWWQAGRIRHLPGEVRDDGIRFEPPEAFLDVLDALPTASAEDDGQASAQEGKEQRSLDFT